MGSDRIGDGAAGWRLETTAGGVRYVLPRRGIGGQEAVGLGIAGFGLGGLALVLYLSRGLWLRAITTLGTGGGGWVGWVVGLIFPVLFLFVAARVVRFGLLLAFGRTAVEVDGARVTGTDRWGPLRSRRSVKIEAVERVVVEPGMGVLRGRGGGAVANLVIERDHRDEKKRRVWIAHGYPAGLVCSLADEIGGRIGRVVAVEAERTLGDRVVEAFGPERIGPVERVTRPARATGVLAETADGISIDLPAMGYFKASKGLGSFAILWLGFISMFTAVFVGSMVRGGFGGTDLFAVAIIGVFWCVGGGMAYSAYRSGRRRGVIDVVGTDLLITRQSVGAAKAESWTGEEIERVAVGASGVEINDRPVLELQVWLRAGGKRGFFSERADSELRWIAGEVSAALGIGAGGWGDGDR